MVQLVSDTGLASVFKTLTSFIMHLKSEGMVLLCVPFPTVI